jgi:hypothetical protein
LRCVPASLGVGNFPVGCYVSAGEATTKCCGVVVAMPRGNSRAPPPSIEQHVNTGTVPVLTCSNVSSEATGWAHRRPNGPERGGAAVVLRAGESPAHGEGRQRNREGKETAMPKDAPLNSGAPEAPMGSHQRVSGMQAKLHRWAAADHGRRFDDLFNLVCDPATLRMAIERVRRNKGAQNARSGRPHRRQRRARDWPLRVPGGCRRWARRCVPGASLNAVTSP